MTGVRSPLLLLAALTLGCSRGAPPEPAPVEEPAPPSPPLQPAPATPPQPPPGLVIDGYPDFCVVRNGRLENVEIEYNSARGDSVYQGVPLSTAFPTDSTYALNAAWYRDGMPIPFAQGSYIKYGLPRLLSTTDVVPIGTLDGVTVFAEPTVNRDRPDVIYIPVRPGCEFQPYTRAGIK